MTEARNRPHTIRMTTRVYPSDHLTRNLCKKCEKKHGKCSQENKNACMFSQGNPIPRHRWRDVVGTAHKKRKVTVKGRK